MKTEDLSQHWVQYQPLLLKNTDPEIGVTGSMQKLLIILDTIDPESFVELKEESTRGHPKIDRVAIFSVFIGLCRFLTIKSLPFERSMSSIFKEFCQKDLNENVHEETIKRSLGEPL